jgi:hypothetical protein
MNTLQIKYRLMSFTIKTLRGIGGEVAWLRLSGLIGLEEIITMLQLPLLSRSLARP